MSIFVKSYRRANSIVRSYRRKSKAPERIRTALAKTTKAMYKVSPAPKIHGATPVMKKRLKTLEIRYNRLASMPH